MENNLTLEEYYEQLEEGVMYEYEDTCFMVISSEQIRIPTDYKNLQVSITNRGGYFLTFYR